MKSYWSHFKEKLPSIILAIGLFIIVPVVIGAVISSVLLSDMDEAPFFEKCMLFWGIGLLPALSIYWIMDDI